jgi:hypothetical protein
MAVRRPIRVEGRLFVRDADVINEGLYDCIAPDLVDKPAELRAIEHAVGPLSGIILIEIASLRSQ